MGSFRITTLCKARTSARSTRGRARRAPHRGVPSLVRVSHGTARRAHPGCPSCPPGVAREVGHSALTVTEMLDVLRRGDRGGTKARGLLEGRSRAGRLAGCRGGNWSSLAFSSKPHRPRTVARRRRSVVVTGGPSHGYGTGVSFHARRSPTSPTQAAARRSSRRRQRAGSTRSRASPVRASLRPRQGLEHRERLRRHQTLERSAKLLGLDDAAAVSARSASGGTRSAAAG